MDPVILVGACALSVIIFSALVIGVYFTPSFDVWAGVTTDACLLVISGMLIGTGRHVLGAVIGLGSIFLLVRTRSRIFSKPESPQIELTQVDNVVYLSNPTATLHVNIRTELITLARQLTEPDGSTALVINNALQLGLKLEEERRRGTRIILKRPDGYRELVITETA
jgi:hypothetical protein